MKGRDAGRPISRRTFAGAASALMTSLLAMPGWAQEGAASQSAASESAASQGNSGAGAGASPDVTSLKTQTEVNRLTTEVFVNGKGPYKFVVDTGAERSVLADTVVRDLGLTPSGRANVQGLILKIPTDLVTIDTLRYGSFSREKLVVPVLPSGLLGGDGCLGLDIINGTRITFAFKDQTIRIQKPGSFMATDWDATVVVIRGAGKGGRLRSNVCSVDGVKTVAFIDTGSESTIGNMSLFRALSSGDHPDVGAAILQGATGGEATGRLTPVKIIELQGLLFEDGTIVVSDVPDFDQWGVYSKPAILIGMDFLRKFASVTIDYQHKEITFELARAQINDKPPRVVVT